MKGKTSVCFFLAKQLEKWVAGFFSLDIFGKFFQCEQTRQSIQGCSVGENIVYLSPVVDLYSLLSKRVKSHES